METVSKRSRGRRICIFGLSIFFRIVLTFVGSESLSQSPLAFYHCRWSQFTVTFRILSPLPVSIYRTFCILSPSPVSIRRYLLHSITVAGLNIHSITVTSCIKLLSLGLVHRHPSHSITLTLTPVSIHWIQPPLPDLIHHHPSHIISDNSRKSLLTITVCILSPLQVSFHCPSSNIITLTLSPFTLHASNLDTGAYYQFTITLHILSLSPVWVHCHIWQSITIAGSHSLMTANWCYRSLCWPWPSANHHYDFVGF